jgi:carbon-monoxide dehydrogenase large subunit
MNVNVGADWRPRVEDDALLRGRGRYADDVPVPNQCFGCFVRSPHAHARIRALDVEAARRAPGVLAVLTGADMEAAKLGNVSRVPPLNGRGGKPLFVPHRPALARDVVRHVGDPVALVVAETPLAAQDAAEQVSVEYEELKSVVDARAAMAPGAPQLWPEAPENVAIDWPGLKEDAANEKEVERIIASAPRVARVSLLQQRIVVASMEPRGATASYDPATDRYTLRVCSQGVGPFREQMMGIMGVEREKIRLLTDDVGGAFGLKTGAYPEYPAMLVAARKVGRPVHWMSTRSESFQSDNHARDSYSDAELALDEKGRFLALRVRHLQNLGGYITAVGVHLSTVNVIRCFPTVYAIPKIVCEVKCIFTNTVPTGPYRGAGRPEANYVMERLVDEAARVTGIDRVELRRRNMIPASAMPYKTPFGAVYDSGDFVTILDKALALSRYAEFGKRRAQSEKSGKRRGIGLSCFLEHSGAQPTESASITFVDGDKLVLALNVQNTGQGHATVFPRLLAERLGIKPEQIRHQHGDSDLNLRGYASVGSRSAMTAGHAVVLASDTLIAKGKKAAAHLLEAGGSEIDYRDGAFEVRGTNRRMPLFELAERARALTAKGVVETLDTQVTAETPQTFPNGCHIAEVEIDPETGVVKVVGYTAVDDCGKALDHVIVEAQVQGGVAQGLGQAILENIVYDPANGQLVTGSFMDYAMPRADEVPDVVGDVHNVPATTNPLGVKGVGEAGTTASLAAIMNAIADAIPGEAGNKLDMPATPEKVWLACRQAASLGDGKKKPN